MDLTEPEMLEPLLWLIGPGEHAVILFPNRATVARFLKHYNTERDPFIRTQSLMNRESLSLRTTGATLYLRTPRQLTAANRNHCLDNGLYMLRAPGVRLSERLAEAAKAAGLIDVTYDVALRGLL